MGGLITLIVGNNYYYSRNQQMDGKHHLMEEDGLLFKLCFYIDCYGVSTSIQLGHTPQISHHLLTKNNSHKL